MKREEGERIKKEEEERIRKEEEERRRKEEEERIKKEEEERIKKEEEEKNKGKSNEETMIKQENIRFKKELEEKKKSFEEKTKNYNLEYEKMIKSQEEEKIKKEEKEERWKNYQKLGVTFHNKKEIREKYLSVLNYEGHNDKYQIQPKTKSPYNSGKLSKETINEAIKLFNCYRFCAGIPDEVVNDSAYEKYAQDASLLMKVNNLLSHSGQPKPRGMNDKLYKSGEKGCASCNIANGYSNLFQAIKGWVRDDGVEGLGHRRWVINPTMKKTGFGSVLSFHAMYCFDGNFEKTEYKNIAWPCTNMPLEFGITEKWCISTGKNVEKDIEVKLINNKNGEVKIFSNQKKNLEINNSNYGINGCIIFDGPFKNNDGDSYRVDIKGKNIAISYDVNFFNVVCHHEKELIEIIEPSCIQKGKKFFYCKICDLKKEEDISCKEHKNKLINEILPTCTKIGKKYYECEFCYKKSEIDVEIIPHNYNYTLISKDNGESKGVCQDCNNEIKFFAPTKYKLWWKFSDSTDGYYSGGTNFTNKINNEVCCWIDDINGDEKYRDFIIEVSDNSLIKLPEKEITEFNDLVLIGIGRCEIIVYPKYNPDEKKTIIINITE